MLNYFLKLTAESKARIVFFIIFICLIFNIRYPSMPGVYILPVFLAALGIGLRASMLSIVLSLTVSIALALNSFAPYSKMIVQHVMAFAVYILVAYLGIQIRKYNLDLQKEYKHAIELSAQLKLVNEKILYALVEVLEKKDKYLLGHSQNVAKYAVEIGKQIGLWESELEELYKAALLHDIGKLAIDAIVLNKSAKLNSGEWLSVKQHPEKGASIVKQIPGYENIAQMILYHHQHYDGNGYPLSIKGSLIPLGARIIAIADSFDAMTSERSYRRKLNIGEAAEEIKRCAGTQFDPELVDVFIKSISHVNLKEVGMLKTDFNA